MINKFKHFIKDKTLFEADDRVLLAVSGGVDSVVMAYMFHRAGYKFGIAHCNFQLRGIDSEADEEFVKDLAKNLEVPFYTIRFETLAYADAHKLSIQMAARELRYEWFQNLLVEHGYNCLATAHHKDDLAETVILNLIKGSVVKGLHGILPKNGNIIRPLLCMAKDEIMEYAGHNKIKYREDKSNSDSKYQRNLIRNEVIPLLQKINPDLAETLFQTSDRRRQLGEWVDIFSKELKEKIFLNEEAGIKVKISDLKIHNIPPEIFFEWVSEFGFNYVQVQELLADLETTETRTFYAQSSDDKGAMIPYRMIKDRESILITEDSKQEFAEVKIEEGESFVSVNGLSFKVDIVKVSESIDLKDTNSAFLDADNVIYPLTIRRWENGDSFIPFGLKGTKLLSDFLTDLKVSHLEKENQLVVISNNKICWVVGRRIDDRFKIHHSTKRVLNISIKN